MRYTGLLALAAFGRLVAGVTPEESKCRFRGVRLMFFDDSDVNLYNMLITFREQVKQTGRRPFWHGVAAGVDSRSRVLTGCQPALQTKRASFPG